MTTPNDLDPVEQLAAAADREAAAIRPSPIEVPLDLEDGIADIDPAGDPDDVDDLEDGTP